MGFGSGQFKRNWWLFIHWAGDKANITARGKANAEKDKCKDKLQPTQIDFFASNISEMSVEMIIEKVVRYCRVDGDTSKKGENPFSLEAFNEALLEDMKQLEEAFGLAEMVEEAESDPSSLNVQDAVRSVRDPSNPYNWLLVQPKPNAKVGAATVQAIGKQLKKTTTKDASQPAASPFGEFKLKKTPHPAVMADIARGSAGSSLKSVETDDKSAPWIDSSVSVGKSKHSDVMAAIKNLP